MQGATVTVRSMTALGDVHTAAADPSGEVSFPGLKPGDYRVETTQPGFSISVAPQVSVQPREVKTVVISSPK